MPRVALPSAIVAAAIAAAVAAGPAGAQTTTSPAAAAPPPASAQPAAPDKLVVYFDEGSATVRAPDVAVLDHASRLFREGQPIVMILSGSTDTVGSPISNLVLSQRRADTVLNALVARGIPAEHLQVLAKGESDARSSGSTAGRPEPSDRRVEISWR